MGFFDFLKGPDINQGVQEYGAVPGAVLLDVRTPQEYREGHIPGSVNAPLQALGGAGRVPAGKDVPLFVYCHSGASIINIIYFIRVNKFILVPFISFITILFYYN